MKRSVIALVAVVLTGCANLQYGVYTPLNTANSARLAIDASNVLPRAYAPSVTRFNVKQDTSEAFGSTLVLLLRQKGYAVAENPQFWRLIYPAPNAPGFSFNYVIDQVSDDQTRLTLMVEGSSISRLYRMVNGVAMPVGLWAKRD